MFMFFFMRVDMDHDVTHIGKPVKDKSFDLFANIMGLLDRHGRIHLQFEIDDHELTGTAGADGVNVLHAVILGPGK